MKSFFTKIKCLFNGCICEEIKKNPLGNDEYIIERTISYEQYGSYFNWDVLLRINNDLALSEHIDQSLLAQLQSFNQDGQTIWHIAIKYKAKPLLISLIENDRDPKLSIDTKNRQGETPLIYAIKYLESKDACDILKILIKGGATPNFSETKQYKVHSSIKKKIETNFEDDSLAKKNQFIQHEKAIPQNLGMYSQKITSTHYQSSLVGIVEHGSQDSEFYFKNAI